MLFCKMKNLERRVGGDVYRAELLAWNYGRRKESLELGRKLMRGELFPVLTVRV